MPSKNIGKIFEDEFKDCIPADYYYLRLKDSSNEYRGVANPCDFLLYHKPFIMLVELKSHKGKSIPFDKIREAQLKGLSRATQHKGIYGGFIFNFRDLEETYYVPVDAVYRFINRGERKSIPVSWCNKVGYLISQSKKRVRYRYNLSEWLRRYNNASY